MVILQTDGELEHDRVESQLFSQLVTDLDRICTGSVALVDEGETRDIVTTHLTIDGDRLALHARDGTQHQDGSVEYSQRSLHFHGEINVTRCIDDVDVIVTPLEIGRCGLNGDSALALKFHRVHRGSDTIFSSDLMNCVDSIGIEQDPLGEGRLTAVDVCTDADVAHQLNILAHSISPRDGVPLLSGSIVPGIDAGGVVTRSTNHELRGYR